MDVDALVLVMLEPEAAGIGVEPEAFGPRADRPVPLAPDPPSAAANASPSHTRLAEGGPIRAGPVAAAEPFEAAIASGERSTFDRIVLLSGLAVFLTLAALIALI